MNSEIEKKFSDIAYQKFISGSYKEAIEINPNNYWKYQKENNDF